MYGIISIILLFDYIFSQGVAPDAVIYTSGMFAIADVLNSKKEFSANIISEVKKQG